MSHNGASPPSRPPSSASSTASSSLGSLNSLARVHDHTRPLPPPRLLPDTAPPASPRPLATTTTTTSFRSATRTPVPEPISILSTRQILTPTSINNNVSSGTSEVSLQSPRPDGERIVNEYVDTPLRPKEQAEETSVVDAQLKPSNHQRTCPKTERRPFGSTTKGSAPLAARVHRQQQRNNNHLDAASGRHESSRVITKQPQTFTKEPARLGHDAASGNVSIFCDHCGKCRCEGCREVKSLPSRWICNNSCFCSAESVLDYASCVCCVKGLFYHCADSNNAAPSSSADSDAGDNCADEPCSCTGSRKVARWTCLGALALVLPCLLCYWPLKGCMALCEACYTKQTMKGCRCDPRNLAATRQPAQVMDASETLSRTTDALMRDSRDPEKRLLDAIGPDL